MIKCEECLYRKNCQFLASHKKTAVEGCTAFKSESGLKAEAIKEFAERLKEMDGYNNHTFDDCASIFISEEYRKGRDEKIKEIWNTIDCLKKEMEGGENDTN